jgi:hypothetical protein
MGKFAYLTLGKEKSYKIGETEYIIKPLTARYLGIFIELSDKTDRMDAMQRLVLVSLQYTDPSLTLDDIQELPVKNLQDLMTIIMDVNGLSDKI